MCLWVLLVHTVLESFVDSKVLVRGGEHFDSSVEENTDSFQDKSPSYPGGRSQPQQCKELMGRTTHN